eukprot:GHVU01026976.1.p1 GENE.GHVU01026976.1~~GHVU01026976.1.p1  ORF type:complete len:103 (+),score=0.19 GHVU01026976.1:55-363(+)
MCTLNLVTVGKFFEVLLCGNTKCVQTDQPTDKAVCRPACSQLKIARVYLICNVPCGLEKNAKVIDARNHSSLCAQECVYHVWGLLVNSLENDCADPLVITDW